MEEKKTSKSIQYFNNTFSEKDRKTIKGEEINEKCKNFSRIKKSVVSKLKGPTQRHRTMVSNWPTVGEFYSTGTKVMLGTAKERWQKSSYLSTMTIEPQQWMRGNLE